MTKTDSVIVYGTIIREEDLAWLVELEHSGAEHWLPKSQVELYGQNRFAIPAWLARHRGIT